MRRENGAAIRLEKDDVTVEELYDECCDDCTVSPTTHRVVIDFRSAGQTQEFGRYCRACAETVATRIRDGLPAANMGADSA